MCFRSKLFNQSLNSRPRRSTLCGLLVLLTSIYFIFFGRSFDLDNLDQPPTYEKLKKWESALPQHNLYIPFPEGRTGRYVLFKNQLEEFGWNNELNEVLMNTWLAYKSKRAYVFRDHVWTPKHYPWHSLTYWWSRPRTPINAFISGPPAGGSWDPDDNAPRSISEDWFNTVCPKSERRIIYTGDVKPAIYSKSGDEIFNHWEKLLTDAPERCIEVQPSRSDGMPQIFDFFLWGSTRILPLWDEYKTSPVSRLLAPSAIVKAAVDRNEYLFLPRTPRWPTSSARDPYERVLAIHLRRGDFKAKCRSLAKWNSTFNSWNLLPFLPDKFIHPERDEWGGNTPEGNAHYQEHCYPESDMILEKIRKSREEYIQAASLEHKVLDTIFLLTNDATGWVDDLKTKLMQSGWHTVVTSRDLQLDQEQKDVSLAVDMEFAIKAAVFIGNGWSSFTSGIVHRRLVAGKEEPLSIRFL